MDTNAIRQAIAAAVSAAGVACDAQPRDAVPSVPRAVVMAPVIIYSTAMRGESADLRLDLILLTSDAPPAEQSGQQLSQLAGTVAAAIEADPTLAGTAQWAHVLTASAASRIEWAGQTYMSSRLTLSIGSG